MFMNAPPRALNYFCSLSGTCLGENIVSLFYWMHLEKRAHKNVYSSGTATDQ